MTTYADPTRCPDCHAVLPHDPQVCRVCSLPLTGQTAVSLFTTLQEADRLLGVLRTQKRPAPAAVGAPAAPAAPTAPAAGGSLLQGAEPFPAPGPRPPHRTDRPTLGGASVPKVLLSLGALCLLVAAVIFLAVAWRWLGVGGRTVVLVAMTGTSLGLAVGMHRRRLRMAAEALSVVGTGLLVLDVVGVRHAGWLGPISGDGLVLLIGAVVAAGSLLMLVATARRPLLSPGVLAPLGVLVAWGGVQDATEGALSTVVVVLLLLGLARLGAELPSAPLKITSLVSAGITWMSLVALGVDRAGNPFTVAHYWGDHAAWPLLAATALVAVAGPVSGVRREVAVGGYPVAGLVGSYAVLLPVLDNAPTSMVACVLATSAVWVVALVLVPGALRAAVLLPLGGTLVVPAVAVLQLAAQAGRSVGTVGAPFSHSFGVRLSPDSTSISPLLILPTLLVAAGAGCATLALVEPVRLRTWLVACGSALGLGAVLTLPLYDVPLALVAGLVLAAGLGSLAAGERATGTIADVARLVGLALVAAAAVLALPSNVLTTAVLAVACVVAGYLMARADATASVAALCFPIAFAGLVWAGADVAGVDGQYRAIPVLLVLAALAIWRPQLELEASTAAVAAVVSAASVALAQDFDVSLAVHLTVAGALVTATSIIHPSRRLLAWPGGLLLAAATWVRLLDLGVHVPEAYTLPSALVLVTVGLWRLRQDDTSATLTYLAPGLSLATVPSLLAMLDDPASPRALVLGVACLVLAVGGAGLRWSAPLVVGAAVGAVLVLRELAPYAGHVPTWTTIGVSGVLLLAVGITWESRMNDVRRASHYLASLR